MARNILDGTGLLDKEPKYLLLDLVNQYLGTDLAIGDVTFSYPVSNPPDSPKNTYVSVTYTDAINNVVRTFNAHYDRLNVGTLMLEQDAVFEHDGSKIVCSQFVPDINDRFNLKFDISNDFTMRDLPVVADGEEVEFVMFTDPNSLGYYGNFSMTLQGLEPLQPWENFGDAYFDIALAAKYDNVVEAGIPNDHYVRSTGSFSMSAFRVVDHNDVAAPNYTTGDYDLPSKDGTWFLDYVFEVKAGAPVDFDAGIMLPRLKIYDLADHSLLATLEVRPVSVGVWHWYDGATDLGAVTYSPATWDGRTYPLMAGRIAGSTLEPYLPAGRFAISCATALPDPVGDDSRAVIFVNFD